MAYQIQDFRPGDVVSYSGTNHKLRVQGSGRVVHVGNRHIYVQPERGGEAVVWPHQVTERTRGERIDQ